MDQKKTFQYESEELASNFKSTLNGCNDLKVETYMAIDTNDTEYRIKHEYAFSRSLKISSKSIKEILLRIRIQNVFSTYTLT